MIVSVTLSAVWKRVCILLICGRTANLDKNVVSAHLMETLCHPSRLPFMFRDQVLGTDTQLRSVVSTRVLLRAELSLLVVLCCVSVEFPLSPAGRGARGRPLELLPVRARQPFFRVALRPARRPQVRPSAPRSPSREHRARAWVVSSCSVSRLCPRGRAGPRVRGRVPGRCQRVAGTGGQATASPTLALAVPTATPTARRWTAGGHPVALRPHTPPPAVVQVSGRWD